jgi:ketosteroid isomerase-like protein
MIRISAAASVAAACFFLAAAPAKAGPEEDRAKVSALDIAYQAAVKRNDAEAMSRILDERFVLILGNGNVIARDALLAGSRSGKIVYEQQDEVPGSQTVRVWGDTAVVTAQLWLKGTNEGQAFDRHLWFSDTYVRTPGGWRYALGQASLPLPPPAPAPSG